MADPNPPTQTELLEQQRVLMEQLTTHIATLREFNTNPADVPVSTESGEIPSLRGLIEQIRQLNGARRHEISWSSESLLRYASSAEAMLRYIQTVPLYVIPGLVGSYFKLETVTTQPLVLEVKWGSLDPFTVTFAANSDTGVVTGGPAGPDPVLQPAGTLVVARLKSSAWTAEGMALTMVSLVDAPAAAA